MGEPALSVVVATYDRPSELARVLEGYRLQTFRDFEVVVADDGSGPETAAVIEREKARGGLALVHARHEHSGFRAAAARNMGVRASSGKWIVFADGDCIPFPDFLDEHARAREEGSFLAGDRYLLEEDEARAVTVEAVASRAAFDGAPAREKRRLRNLAAKNAFYRLSGLKPDRPKLLTSNCSVSREAFLRVNGLDERYEGWGREDDDLRRRLVRSGLRARSVVGKANLLHLWHKPVASFKGRVRAGPNEPYFQRGFFLARCRVGLERLPLDELVFAISSPDEALARAMRAALLGDAGAPEPPSFAPVEVEVVVDPQGGSSAPRFERKAEVRVLVQPGAPRTARVKGAHVLLHGGADEGEVDARIAKTARSVGEGALGPAAFKAAAEVLDALV